MNNEKWNLIGIIIKIVWFNKNNKEIVSAHFEIVVSFYKLQMCRMFRIVQSRCKFIEILLLKMYFQKWCWKC